MLFNTLEPKNFPNFPRIIKMQKKKKKKKERTKIKTSFLSIVMKFLKKKILLACENGSSVVSQTDQLS